MSGRDAIVAVLIWAGVTILLATHLWLAIERRHALPVVAAWVMAHTGPWLLIAFGVYAIAARHAALHLPGAAIAVVLAPALQWLGMRAALATLPNPFNPPPELAALAIGKLPASVITYAALAGAVHYLLQRRRAAALEAAARAAELRVLQARLQPHFLFNALHSVVALIGEDPEAARAMLVRLSDLLRSALQTGGEQQVPLSAELRWAEAYLAIERVRFEDRLQLQFDVSDDAASARVPALILQPLLENAIRHGIAASEEGGRLSIRAAVNRGALRVGVETRLDSPPAERTEGLGIGLDATRARLQLLYGRRATLEHAFGDGGSQVTISLPCGDAA